MIIVLDFEIITFYVLFVYKLTFSVIFFWIKGVRVSRNFNSSLIVFQVANFTYISSAKLISLVKGYIGVKISKHDIW